MGPKIWSVNILILNQGCPMNNSIPLQATIMNFSKLTLIEWEIEDLCVLRYNCQECFTEHPCQDQHMSHGGVWNRSHGLSKLLSTSIRCVLES